ncbi:hypothetical protein ISF_08626 [Cordyceps fumosorosea ARSEF 2679]|uniref:Uncharacterized protein n=1 Tax=Cordyceps fumosorosea (strain ARSEF 2679) TaxID=1081104 RepID=A0A167LYK9_CORFA|nr:hypothetical protein ISF_08626 [Cordyceps fumosorosea ARSEF 2679]OAA53687.1 hypothetical protein ISF_08626 [Cordyceps fumosorosea ARSEF 2679]
MRSAIPPYYTRLSIVVILIIINIIGILFTTLVAYFAWLIIVAFCYRTPSTTIWEEQHQDAQCPGPRSPSTASAQDTDSNVQPKPQPPPTQPPTQQRRPWEQCRRALVKLKRALARLKERVQNRVTNMWLICIISRLPN